MAMMREAVTTPVPPMPGMWMTVVPDQRRSGGSGSAAGGVGYVRGGCPARPEP